MTAQQHQEQAERRFVRFAQESSFEVRYLDVDEEGDAQRSHMSADFAERKERRRQEAEECKSKGYGFLMMDSFEDPVAHVQKHINAFARLPDNVCGRGLERQVSNKHDWERREWRAKCVQNVLAAESKLRFQGGWNDEDNIWEELAKISKQASRSAKRFARRLGKADEVVVQQGELEDLDDALTMVNEIKAFQMKRNYESVRSVPAASVPDSPGVRSLGGRRASMQDLTNRPGMSQSFSGRLRRTPARSLSDRVIDGSIIPKRHLEFDRTSSPFDDQQDDNKSRSSQSSRKKRRERRKSTTSSTATPTTPTPPKKFIKRWSSFKILDTKTEDVAKEPYSPHPTTRRTRHAPNTNTAPTQQSPVRGMLQRWNSWSIGNGVAKRAATTDELPKSPATSYTCSSSNHQEISLSASFSTLSQMVVDKEEDTDFDDSMIFNRRRTHQAPAYPPSLATLEELDNSWTDSGNNNGNSSSKSFFAKWSSRRKKTESSEQEEGPMRDDSGGSLDLTDLNGGDDESTVGSRSTRSRRRRTDDWSPKAPPATRYSSSPRKHSATSPRKQQQQKETMTHKKLQLLKAERWASSKFAQSTSALGTVDELSQQTHQDWATVVSDIPRVTRRRDLHVTSNNWNSASALLETEQEEPNPAEFTPKRKRTLKRILRSWSSSSRLIKVVESPTANKSPEGDNKPRRGRLTRWSSLGGRKSYNAQDDSSTVLGSSQHSSTHGTLLMESPEMDMSLPEQTTRRRPVLRHTNSTSALFADDGRKAPDRTDSDSTLESDLTALTPPVTPTKEQKLKQNLIVRLKTRGNLLQGRSSRLYLGPNNGRRATTTN
ncbi:expressed unknown protein [Seminavis robusta]|uniref:Uncharacterized protein n=1 Tax=Seminavis robusta TaxID=568900 RepID=A0A9N8H7B0_9STRA|nr:expressed unknown protein [Seminavis robusta]|eukprot:Sro198_g084090.1 n/a (829) ;mRNA; r:49279-51765